jgi:ferritin
MAIEGPPAASESPLDMFEKTLELEEFITEGIDDSTAKTL